MNREVNIGNNKKRLKLYYGLLITVLCIIGVSFAWFRLYLSQSSENSIATRTCFSTTLTEDTSKIELTDAFPISDEDGLKQYSFTFTLKNNCNGYVKAYITIKSEYRENTDTSYLNDDYLKVNISPKDTVDNPSLLLSSQDLIDLDAGDKGYKMLTTYLGANEEKSYDLRIWMDSEVTVEQGLNKKWAGKVVVVNEASNEPPVAPKGWYEAANGTLLAALRDNNELKKTITVPGMEVSAHLIGDSENITFEDTGTYKNYYVTYGINYEISNGRFNLVGASVTNDTYENSYANLVGKYLGGVSSYFDFSESASDISGTLKATTGFHYLYYIVSATPDSLVYKQLTSNKKVTEAVLSNAEDDYGMSFYFRGSVKNNYVEFANKCWRIVRVSGDGSIKLVLHNDNIAKNSTPCAAINNSSTAAFAHYNSDRYTTPFNSRHDDNAYIGFMYGTTSSSDYSSTHTNINKSTILTNLETWYKNNLAMYEDKLADVIWCNDKSTLNDGLAYGNNDTDYNSYRLYTTKMPSLICHKDNNDGKLSKFTVSDVLNGNGNLTYKVGLLTVDEVAFSGLMVLNFNYSSYLQENTGGNSWWLLSPFSFKSDFAYLWYVSSSRLDGVQVGVYGVGLGLRPAVSLMSDVVVTGAGTSEDPYVVK